MQDHIAKQATRATRAGCMLAKTYCGTDPAGWMMSEKMDGVRAIWDGEKLWSRNGNEFHAPASWKAGLPSTRLDGELFIGRKQFQRTVGIVRKARPVDSEWTAIKFRCFDAPDIRGGFEQRLAAIPSHLRVEHVECTSAQHLAAFYGDIVSEGGEGVMLRKPGSAYACKRSPWLLKYKPLHTDEAVVVAHVAGEGKHLGRLGAVRCVWRGVSFCIGTGFSDEDRASPPALGARVTFGYQELTDAGVPRFPVFIVGRDYE